MMSETHPDGVDEIIACPNCHAHKTVSELQKRPNGSRVVQKGVGGGVYCKTCNTRLGNIDADGKFNWS